MMKGKINRDPFEESKIRILEYLFEQYCLNPDKIFEVTDEIDTSIIDAVELTDQMISEDLIKERRIYPENRVGCTITLKGINSINHAYYNKLLLDIIEGLGNSNGRGDIIAILKLSHELHSIGLQFTNELKDLGYLHNIDASFKENFIMAELTESGWEEFRNKTQFF